jgi:hypothetical protein
VIGSQPGTIGLTLGTRAAGFVGAICDDLGNGRLSVLAGDPKAGDWIALEFRSDGTVSTLSVALGGVTWIVLPHPQGTLGADDSGTFSGTDAKGGADVRGTFAC